MRDLQPHRLEDEDCPCLPTIEPMLLRDGSFGRMVVHNAWDGRP